MIVNRMDYHVGPGGQGFGVGWQLMSTGWCEPQEVSLLCELLSLRRRHHGDGVVAVDCGANIGTVTVSMASACTGWGEILAFEAQERIYYALAGNVAINNCLNARVMHAAVGVEEGILQVPHVDYTRSASFGSLELRQREAGEDIGQSVRYDTGYPVPMVAIDTLGLSRIDLLKIDVEGMEFDVLDGARESIARHKPILFIEYIKIDRARLAERLAADGYKVATVGINALAIHSSDPSLAGVAL